MDQAKRNNWPLLVLVFVLGGVAAWWFFGRKGGEKDSAAGQMAGKVMDEAKREAVKMTMEVVSMSITEIRNNRIQVANKVEVHNPLPVALRASRLDYRVMAGKTKVAEGSYTRPIHVPAGGDTLLTLPMQVLVPAMDRVNDQAGAAGRDSVTYTFYNTIHADVPVAGKRQIPFQVKATLPVVWVPVIQAGKIDIDKLGFKRSAMDMVLDVTNPNSFTIRMSGGRYSMTIDDRHTMEGRMTEAIVLPAGQTTPVAMHMETKTGRALKMGWKMLFDKKGTRYALTFDSKIASDRKLLQGSRMHFTDEGTLHDLIREVKKKIE